MTRKTRCPGQCPGRRGPRWTRRGRGGSRVRTQRESRRRLQAPRTGRPGRGPPSAGCPRAPRRSGPGEPFVGRPRARGPIERQHPCGPRRWRGLLRTTTIPGTIPAAPERVGLAARACSALTHPVTRAPARAPGQALPVVQRGRGWAHRRRGRTGRAQRQTTAQKTQRRRRRPTPPPHPRLPACCRAAPTPRRPFEAPLAWRPRRHPTPRHVLGWPATPPAPPRTQGRTDLMKGRKRDSDLPVGTDRRYPPARHKDPSPKGREMPWQRNHRGRGMTNECPQGEGSHRRCQGQRA